MFGGLDVPARPVEPGSAHDDDRSGPEGGHRRARPDGLGQAVLPHQPGAAVDVAVVRDPAAVALGTAARPSPAARVAALDDVHLAGVRRVGEGRRRPDRVGSLDRESGKELAPRVERVDEVVEGPEHDVLLAVARDVADRRSREDRIGPGVRLVVPLGESPLREEPEPNRAVRVPRHHATVLVLYVLAPEPNDDARRPTGPVEVGEGRARVDRRGRVPYKPGCLRPTRHLPAGPGVYHVDHARQRGVDYDLRPVDRAHDRGRESLATDVAADDPHRIAEDRVW